MKLIGILLLFITTTQSYSQATHDLAVSLRAGYVSSNIHGSYVDLRSSKTPYSPHAKPVFGKEAFELACSLHYPVYKYISLITGIGFIQKGGGIDDWTPVYPMDITLNYLNIPVEVAVHILQYRKLAAAIQGGIIFNYEISSEQDFKKGYVRDPGKSRKFIPSVGFGGSLQYNVNRKVAITGEVRVLNDLSPFFERTLQEKLYKMKTKGEVFSIGAKYKLH